MPDAVAPPGWSSPAPEPLPLSPCEPTREHAALVMAWRNDPTTLAMFYHHEPKVWESFWPEFRDRYFVDADLPPAFALADGRAVAFLRFERIDDESEGAPAVDISVNVDPEARGRGYGVAALAGAIVFLRERGVAACWAEIRPENAASRRAFLRAGWREVDEVEKTIVDTGETCTIRRYVVNP